MRGRLRGDGMQAIGTVAGFVLGWIGNAVLAIPRQAGDLDGVADLGFVLSLPGLGEATVGPALPVAGLATGCILLVTAAVASLGRNARSDLGEGVEFLTLFLGSLIGGALVLGGATGMALTAESSLATGHWGAYAYANSVASAGLACCAAGNVVRLAAARIERPARQSGARRG